MGKVEGIFTKHFSDHDRRKAMAQLRPMQQRGGHSITFFVGTKIYFLGQIKPIKALDAQDRTVSVLDWRQGADQHYLNVLQDCFRVFQRPYW